MGRRWAAEGRGERSERTGECEIDPKIEQDGEPEIESQIGPDGERELDSEIKTGEESAWR